MLQDTLQSCVCRCVPHIPNRKTQGARFTHLPLQRSTTVLLHINGSLSTGPDALDNGNQALLLLAAMAARSSAGSTKVLCERSWYVVGVVDSWVCGSVSDSAPICAARRWQVGIGSALGTKVVHYCVCGLCVCSGSRNCVLVAYTPDLPARR